MPYGWGESHDAYEAAYTNGRPNEAKLSHELIAGGAAFAGFKAFEDHQRAQGKPVSHQFAKELLAGFAGAEVDKLAETKGEDWFDKERAKHEAKKNAEHMYDEHYIRGHEAEEYHPERYRPHERYEQYGRREGWNEREERREDWNERREERQEERWEERREDRREERREDWEDRREERREEWEDRRDEGRW